MSQMIRPARDPVHCRPEAYRRFAQQIPKLETTDGLLRAAIAVSLHELHDVDPEVAPSRLRFLADRVQARLRSKHREALLAHLHEVLFEEESFVGNSDDYYNPRNSYVPIVLETHKGIPITLTLIYKVVGERLGLHVEGINAPGHFMARVEDRGGAMLVDPFAGGRAMTEEEALQRVEEVIGGTLPPGDAYLQPATHRQWLGRMLASLKNIFTTEGRREDTAAMGELQQLLVT